MRNDSKKNKANMKKYTWLLNRYLLMIAISLSSLFILVFHIISPLKNNQPLIPIMLFFIWISLFLIVIYKSLEETSEKIVKKISNLIDQKTHAAFSDKIVNSRFEFDRMVCNATKSIYIVGPNLHFLTKNSEETMQILFQNFKKNPNFEFHMLISDPELISDCKAEESESNKLKSNTEEIFKVVSEFSFGDKNFEDQLTEGIGIFKGWCKSFEEIKKENSNIKGDFEIRKNGIITISLLFIDADTNNGSALIIPVPRGISGSERPCFLIKYRQHESAFMQYYTAYRRLFSEANKLS